VPIYYVYERATGRFAGSGTPRIETETHASTTVPIPGRSPEVERDWHFDEETQTWVWREVSGQQ